MDAKWGYLSIVLVCLFVIGVGFLRKRGELVLNFLLRLVMGTIGIYIMNAFFLSQNIPLIIGINFLSLLTVGSLGFSGFALLYAVLAFGIL